MEAALNNDLSVDLGWRVANEGMQVTSLESAVENSGKTAVINVEYNLPMGRNSKATVDYIIYGNGYIKVNSTLTLGAGWVS